jgi:murein hydrolase activator
VQNILSGKKLIISTLLLMFGSVLFISASYDDIVNDKKRQIENAQKDIESAKDNIDDIASEIKINHRVIDSLQNELEAIDKLIGDYKDKKFLSALEIAQETNIIMFLEEEVDRIQESFKNKVVNLYKHGKNFELELLLSSKTPNEFLRRNQYLQKFSMNRKKELKELKTKKYLLEEKKKLLGLSVSSQRFYIESKRTEFDKLKEKINEAKMKTYRLENLTILQTEKIKYKEQEIVRINNFLSNIQNYKNNYKTEKYSKINYASDNFTELKGKINIPVDLYIINQEYGDYLNNFTNTKFFNYGIDLSIAKGSKVFAIADGVVSTVSEIPLIGKVIIIKHSNYFRSVYGKMNEVMVKEGDNVRTNQIIGRSGENIEGQGLHFELWNDKTPVNPREWLRE